MAAVEVILHETVSTWLNEQAALNTRQAWHPSGETVVAGVERLIAQLEQQGRTLGRPEAAEIQASAIDLWELRWPPERRGRGPTSMSGIPIIRVLFGYCTIPGYEIALVVLAGDKAEAASPPAWYHDAIPAAEERLRHWCGENPPYQPIMRRNTTCGGS